MSRLLSSRRRATTVNLGIVGTGAAVPRVHLPALRKLPDAFRVVAVANRTRDKAENLAGEIGAPKVYDDYRAAREIIAAGEIGDVFCFQMSTIFDVGTDFRRPWFAKGT